MSDDMIERLARAIGDETGMDEIAARPVAWPRLDRSAGDACSTYEKTQAIYGIEIGQREIIRVVRAEITAALGEEA